MVFLSRTVQNLSMFALDLPKALTELMMKAAQEGGGEHAEKHSLLWNKNRLPPSSDGSLN
uniref:Uncharacterized protein n=1 Tax=Faecalibaculum rodentium TaxID=1702221 RepID=A0A140DV45_9FIRM|nr:hypothetical protein AALO17_13880 [Faecalibaculum rodentium]